MGQECFYKENRVRQHQFKIRIRALFHVFQHDFSEQARNIVYRHASRAFPAAAFEKQDVVIYESVQPVDAMEKLYMRVEII